MKKLLRKILIKWLFDSEIKGIVYNVPIGAEKTAGWVYGDGWHINFHSIAVAKPER